jgi:predicted RNase H-like nuclease
MAVQPAMRMIKECRAGEILMSLILGIDAAWTETGSSGIPVLHTDGNRRTVLVLASSYNEFLTGEPAVRGAPGTRPDLNALTHRAKDIAGEPVDLVAIDMPIARHKFTGRRVADDLVSREFGAQGASTHSPNAMRPGLHGEQITNSFAQAGYALATDQAQVVAGRTVVEVYPLAALVRLLNAEKRPAYKVAKMASYFRHAVPPLDKRQRVDRVLKTWEQIFEALGREISDLDFELPKPSEIKFAVELKPYEDRLDALISAWVGACVLEGRAQPYGDERCAIWVPRSQSA